MLFDSLTKTEAHLKIDGRSFGNLEFPDDILDNHYFDKVVFYRWLSAKNKEAGDFIKAKEKS